MSCQGKCPFRSISDGHVYKAIWICGCEQATNDYTFWGYAGLCGHSVVSLEYSYSVALC